MLNIHASTSLLRIITALLLTAGAPAFANGQGPEPHPFLFFSESDLPAMREKIAGTEWSRTAHRQMKNIVDQHSVFHLPPPNARIRTEWQPAIRSQSEVAKYAAFLHRLEGNPQYLEKAREFLLLYAENFETRVNFHNLEDQDGIVIYDTGTLAINCAWTYDLIYPELSPDERTRIEEKLLRGIVGTIRDTVNRKNMQDAWAGIDPEATSGSTRAPDYDWGPGQWNGNMHCNAGITAIGFVLQDPELYEHGIRNWKTYLARDMLADGMWQEEDFSYSRFCYASMQVIAEMAFQYGYPEDLYNLRMPSRPAHEWDHGYVDAPVTTSEAEDPGYRTLRMFLDAQIDYQYPDLSDGNWGWQTNRASFDVGSNVTFFELGYLRYQLPEYGWILQHMDRSRGNDYAQGLASPILYGGPIADTVAPHTSSRWYPHSKWLILKSVEGLAYWQSGSMYAFMPYGAGRTKGLRTLSLDLYAHGRVLAPRVSKTSRLQAHDKDYYLNDDAWNAFLIDGENLSGIKHRVVSNELDFHAFTPGFKIAQAHVEAERHVRPSIWYPEVAVRDSSLDYRVSRTVGMAAEYVLDIMHLHFTEPPAYKHNYEWVWHAFGELTLEGVKPGELTYNTWSATWKNDDGTGIVTCMLDSAHAKPRGTRVSVRNDTITNYIRVLRGNEQETFVAIHQPFRGESVPYKIQRLFEDNGSVAVRVQAEDHFTDYIGVAFSSEGMLVENEYISMELKGPYAYIRHQGDQINAQGSIHSFSLLAPAVKQVILNGKIIPFQRKGDWILYGK